MPTKKTNTPKPEVAEAVPPAGQVQRRALSPTVAAIADEVAALVIMGEDRSQAEMIVRAAVLRKWTRFYEHLEDDPTKRTANIALHIDREVAEWMGELAGEWKANRRAEPADRPDPVNVVERIRDVIFYTVRNQFDDFLWRSTAEERLLLHEVFQDHESSTREDPNELVLAYAFEVQVKGRADAFIRCPERLQKQVQTYIDCLKAAEPCKSKAAA